MLEEKLVMTPESDLLIQHSDIVRNINSAAQTLYNSFKSWDCFSHKVTSIDFDIFVFFQHLQTQLSLKDTFCVGDMDIIGILFVSLKRSPQS